MSDDNLEPIRLIMRCRAGAHVGKCFTEGMIKALQEWIPVEFEHNGRKYVCDPDVVMTEYAAQEAKLSAHQGSGS